MLRFLKQFKILQIQICAYKAIRVFFFLFFCSTCLFQIETLASDKDRIKDFNRLYNAYKKVLVPTVNASALKNMDVVLVGGFGSDFLPWLTFTDIDKVLKAEYGLSEKNIHYTFPSSFSGDEEGVMELADILSTIRKVDPKRKILLIGYSRGGVIALKSLIENPGLLDSIHAIATVNSPMGGTAVAEAVRELLDKVSEAATKLSELGNKLRFCNCEYGVNYDFSKGLRGMESRETIVNKLQELNDEDYARLSKALFFITSSTSPLNEPTKVGTYVLTEENDGTVAKSNQFLSSIGRRMADLQAGHTDLMMSSFKSSLNENDRKAFARTLIETLTNPNTFYDP